MIGDGIGWVARAAAIYLTYQEGATGNTLSDFYTEGTGTGLSFQNLENYGLVPTYGTTIADEDGIYNTSNSALEGSFRYRVTGEGEIRDGFEFDPTFNPGVDNGGNPGFDTADFADISPGNLRVDYVLPSNNLDIIQAGVFCPESDHPQFDGGGRITFPSSDRRLVYADVQETNVDRKTIANAKYLGEITMLIEEFITDYLT